MISAGLQSSFDRGRAVSEVERVGVGECDSVLESPSHPVDVEEGVCGGDSEVC